MVYGHTRYKQQTIMHKLVVIIGFLIFLTGCSTPTTLFMETDENSTQLVDKKALKVTDPLIKTGDKITVSIWGHEDLSIGSVNSIYNSNEETGKWVVVDNDGLVNLPKIGRVKLAGYSSKEANFFLEQQYLKHLKDPIINVKILNHYVTALGEVKNPGKYRMNNEKLSLIELLGEAGGLTDHAEPDGIRIIRNSETESTNYSIDLSRAEILYQQNIQLQPNDVIYVVPKKGKEIGKTATKAAPFVGIITGIAVLLSVFLK